jgi:hypothetical protein
MAVTRIALGWVFLCIALGWVFLWAFLDKAFGLGFATERADAWINGGSPTFGCLNFATEGKYLTFSTRQFELPPDRPRRSPSTSRSRTSAGNRGTSVGEWPPSTSSTST